MPDSIAIQPSTLEKTTLFIETLWISLLFYGFYVIARFLPDSPEFKVILNAISEKNQHLDLKGKLKNDLTPITVIKLCMALNKNPSITSVDASFNWLGRISVIAFSKTNGLKSLKLYASRTSNVGAIYLANNTVFESLDLGQNSIGNIGIIALAKNKYLRHLDIHGNKVDGNFAAKIFSTTTSLKSLCLGNVSNEGAIALAGNTTLKFLKIKANRISNAGYIALAANTTLRSIKGCEDSTGYYPYFYDDAEQLKAFFNNKTLIHCDIWDRHWGCKFTSKDFASRNKVLLKNKLGFQVFSSMLETNQLSFDLLCYVGSFLISDSNFLQQVMESAKLRVLRKNALASEAGMFSVVQRQSISKIARDNETAIKQGCCSIKDRLD